MGTTAKGFWFPDGSDDISPLHPVLGAMQTSVDNGLNNPRFDTPPGIHRVTDAAGLSTLVANLSSAGYTVSSSNPAYAFRADTQLLYENTGSGWHVYRNIPVFVNSAARDSVLPSPLTGTFAILSGPPMEITIYNGTTWRTIDRPRQSYTPTFTNFTLGNGTVSAEWSKQGDTVSADVYVQLGSTSIMGSSPSISLPVAAARTSVGSLALVDTGARFYAGVTRTGGPSSTISMTAASTAGIISATEPFVWTTNDVFFFTHRYAVA